jgi:hypothetical protein
MTDQFIEMNFHNRETAIKEHRKMWNWIADTAEKEHRFVTKEEYLMTFGYENYCIAYRCFCCEYNDSFSDIGCNHCPLIWYEGQKERIKKGLHYTYCLNHSSPYRVYDSIFVTDVVIGEEIDIKLFIEAAREIANLPEVREDDE